ncbi:MULTISPECIES: hypothetical protein [Lactococcus]|uniref:Uncharacterized protein n=2 Tax=Lactococcus TaxID=1357 RepID=A0A387BJU1_9LACT|nr:MULTISPECIES: hypothetical protein [Lactococcus]AYG01286.1 hypothetical protein D7I46_09360 [Lactococcus allomyrinae]MCL2114283.1 hypothetical protein [Streptococcaceae bacterium]QDK70128.1 hypothetical protein FLP15_01720 [Lactococcus protaetiae]
MKFQFKGISSYEEHEESNYVGAVHKSVILEFANLQDAINYSADHKDFIISEDGKSAFRVLEICELP